MLNAAVAARFNRAAKFYPQGNDEHSRPCLQIAGIQTYSYIDDDGVFRVSVHLDSTDAAVLDDQGLVPIRMACRMNIEDFTVFDSEQDRISRAGGPAMPGAAVAGCPDVDDRVIELRVDNTVLAGLARRQSSTGRPGNDPEWHRWWIDTVIRLIEGVNCCAGLLTMTGVPGLRSLGIEIGYDRITRAGSMSDGIAVHLRAAESGSTICSRRYFSIEDMQCLAPAGFLTDTRDAESLMRGLVRDLEIEVNNLYREFTG